MVGRSVRSAISLVPSQYDGAVGAEPTARSAGDGDPRAGYLARAGLSAQLTDRLDQQEQAALAGVEGGQAAAVGVDRKFAAEPDPAALDERAGLTLLAEAQVFEGDEQHVGEGVVQFGHVDVLRGDARALEGQLPGDSRR